MLMMLQKQKLKLTKKNFTEDKYSSNSQELNQREKKGLQTMKNKKTVPKY